MTEVSTPEKLPGRYSDGKRTPARKASDRRKAARLAIQGMTQREIAAELGVSETTVHNDLASCRKRWDAEAARNIFELRSREVAKADLLEAEAWGVFENAPDPEARLAALDRVAKAIALRCKITGIERLTVLQRELDTVHEQARQAVDAVVNTVARYLTPAEFQRFTDEVGRQLREVEQAAVAAMPAAPAAVYALPEPEDPDTDPDGDVDE